MKFQKEIEFFLPLFLKRMHRSDTKKPSSTHLLNELNKLKTQQKYMEATQMILKPVSHMPSELNELNELECLKIEQDLNLVTLEDRLKYDAFRLRDLICDIHCEMLNANGLCKFNAKQYRERIQAIDQHQREFEIKNLKQLNCLKLEYSSIENELQPLMTNLDLLQRMPTTIKNKANVINVLRRAQSAPIDKSDCDDVRRFDRYLKEHGGHTGGWIDEEHLFFIKMKNKYNGSIEQICGAFKAFLIGKSLL